MSALQAAGLIVCALCAVLILKERHGVFSSLAVIAAVIAVFTMAAGELGEAVKFISSSAEESGFLAYAEILLKALGIAYATHFTAEICRGAGEGTLAGAAELFGKAAIIALSIPMASKLLSLAKELLI